MYDYEISDQPRYINGYPKLDLMLSLLHSDMLSVTFETAQNISSVFSELAFAVARSTTLQTFNIYIRSKIRKVTKPTYEHIL